MKTITTSKNLALAAAASLCVTAFAIGAHADEVDATLPTRTVHYSDLNLNTQAGTERLYNRIRNAAKQVCGGVEPRQLAESTPAQNCMSQAIAASVRAVNNPRLTTTYDQHAGVAHMAINVASLR